MQYQPQQDGVIKLIAQSLHCGTGFLTITLQQMFMTSIFLALGQTMLAIIVEYTMRLNYHYIINSL